MTEKSLTIHPHARRRSCDGAKPEIPSRRPALTPGLSFGLRPSSSPRSGLRDPTTRTTRNRRSRSTNGRSGSPTRPRRRSTPSRIYKYAMPGSVGTSRPNIEDKDRKSKFPVSPVSFVQFFGEPRKDVDVDLALKRGRSSPLAPTPSGPAGSSGTSRTSCRPPAGIPPRYLTENHWFNKLRDKERRCSSSMSPCRTIHRL